MLSEWINGEYLDKKRLKNISSDFKAAKPYPNFAFRNFFNPKRLEGVRKEVLREKFERQDKDLFSFSNTNELKFSKSRAIREFYDFLGSEEFIGFISKITQTKLSKIDMHAHRMRQGDYLLFHDDVVEGRKVAYIVYLSKGFAEKDGGRLQLFDIKNPRKPVVQIIPAFGTFAGFEVSKKSLHVVEEVKANKNRFTIGGWFYGTTVSSVDTEYQVGHKVPRPKQ